MQPLLYIMPIQWVGFCHFPEIKSVAIQYRLLLKAKRNKPVNPPNQAVEFPLHYPDPPL